MAAFDLKPLLWYAWHKLAAVDEARHNVGDLKRQMLDDSYTRVLQVIIAIQDVLTFATRAAATLLTRR